MRHLPSFVVFLAGVLALPALASAFDADDVPTVFSIRKSTDQNRIDYGIAIDANCHPVGDDPVRPYYRRSSGSTRPLSLIERTVVGTGTQHVGQNDDGGHVRFRVRSLDDRNLTITTRRTESGCRATVTTRVGGVAAVVTDIYAVFDGPRSVDHVELRGRTSDGRQVQENIRP